MKTHLLFIIPLVLILVAKSANSAIPPYSGGGHTVLSHPETPQHRIIREVATDAGVHPLLIQAIIKTEHSSEFTAPKTRLEENLYRRWNNRERATAYGWMQVVYGWHKDNCALSSAKDLLEFRKNVECGTKIYSDCEDPAILDDNKRTNKALLCYNGGGDKQYPSRVLANLGKIIVGQL